MRGVEPALERAERIAGDGLLHLDHIRAEISEDHARRRTGDEGAHFEHSNARERSCSHPPDPTLVS